MTDFHLHQRHVNQKVEESLSALADGEASILEMHRALKACDESPETRQLWRRYQIISQVLKNSDNSPVGMSVDLSARIKSSITDEPPIGVNEGIEQPVSAINTTAVIKNKKSIWTGIGRFAVAASVAAAVILGVQHTSVDRQAATSVASAPKSLISLPEQVVYEGLANKGIVRTASHSPNMGKSSIQASKQAITISSGGLEKGSNGMQDLQRQLNRLMLEHVENVAQNSHQGILPYARVPGGE